MKETQQPLLAVKNLSIRYGEKLALTGAGFSLPAGGTLAIVGESGSGKSTLLSALLGLLPAGASAEGSICWRGQELVGASEKAWSGLRGREIGMIFQDAGASLCPIRKVGEQLFESLHEICGWDEAEFRARAAGLLASVHLQPEVLEAYPFRLSGGMGQRVGIAAALLPEPRLLLADEPTSALDMVTQKRVVEELQAMREQHGTALVVVTHNMAVAQRLADAVLVLRRGEVVEYGPAEQVFQAPRADYTRSLISAVPRLREVV